MKKNNNIRPTGLKGNESIDRMKSLMGIKESVNKADKRSVVEITKEGPDGKVYAIVRENHKYFIKIANKKDNLLTEDFKYVGGLKNLNEGSYSSYAKAAKHLNLKFISLNEALGFKRMINVLKNDNLTEAFESYNENPKPSQPDTTLGTVKTMGKNDGHDTEIIGDAGKTGNDDVPTPPVVEEDEAIDEDAETVTEEDVVEEGAGGYKCEMCGKSMSKADHDFSDICGDCSEGDDVDESVVKEEAQMGKPRTATSDVTMGSESKPPNSGNIDGQTAPIVVEDEAIDEDAETVTEEDVVEEDTVDEDVELNENEKAVDKMINGLKDTYTEVVNENKLSILTALQKINEGADSQKKKI